MEANSEKLLYVLNFIDDYLNDFIYEILNDSKEDPHYSAVTATNIIKCYIDVMKDLGKSLPYSDVKSYFDFNVYTDEEYNAFEKSRKKESEYYRGVQY